MNAINHRTPFTTATALMLFIAHSATCVSNPVLNLVIAQQSSRGQASARSDSTTAEKTLSQPYRITPRTGDQHIELTDGWQLTYRDAAITEPSELATGSEWMPGSVPGTVQMALHRAGKLPHPYHNLNSEKYKWVDEKVWYYRRAFQVPVTAHGQNVFLAFDGIDYFARVWLNGRLLGRHEGMFGGPVVNIKDRVQYGSANEIVVEVQAGNYGQKATYKPRRRNPNDTGGTIIKPWVLAGGTGAEMFFPLGMWRGARVEIAPRTYLERPFLITRRASKDAADLELTIEVLAGTQDVGPQLHPWDNQQLDNRSNSSLFIPPAGLKAALTLEVEIIDRENGRVALKEIVPLQLSEGRNWINRNLHISEPKLWNVNGFGEPNLHRVRLTLLDSNKPIDRIEFDYGIRTIERRPSAGPRTGDRWTDWQFVVNGQPLFIKGVNWMPADILLDLPPERYRWLLGMAKNAGIQMLRVWGAGLIETEEFYQACNELGIMVWQDFPIGNEDTPEWPQPVWEAQVLHTIFRLRNHPSLAVYCGGNEFNPYSTGNAATIGILERSLALFDPTRFFIRTSPDQGSIHTYPDIDPAWYAKLYARVPYVAETGMHNIPEPGAIREVVDQRELAKPLAGMYTKEFVREHPDFIHHFVEYDPGRVPRMLSRASHIDDMRQPSLESISEASQIGAGEFYQVLSEGMQANYPVTTGLMPWVYKRPWPVIAIMLVDGFGQPNAPYYFLKRTYEPTHIAVQLPRLLWSAGEQLPLSVSVMHATTTTTTTAGRLTASVRVLDESFNQVWEKESQVNVKPGPSVTHLELGAFPIPSGFTDRFFFVVAELQGTDGRLVSRAVYWPRCLKMMEDGAFREKYRTTPQPFPAIDNGPWLKRQVAAVPTSLKVELLSHKSAGTDRGTIEVRVRNTGPTPACMTRVDITNAKRAFYATDNFFWLAPGEERTLNLEVLWRDPASRAQAALTVSAWNASTVQLQLAP